MAKVAIIYYSQTGTTHKLAQAVEEGARNAGAETSFCGLKKPRPMRFTAAFRNGNSTSKKLPTCGRRPTMIWNGLTPSFSERRPDTV
jgi:NAD(P)H dehydrogenase (quinone)